MKNTTIEWCNHTWNPWVGCTKISEGCRECYMYRDMIRFGGNPYIIKKTAKPTFELPLRIQKPALIFVCSWSDFFHSKSDPFREQAWVIMERCTQHTFLILTKRHKNIQPNLPANWGDGWPNVWLGVSVENDQNYDRIKTLINIPAAKRFISYEPAIGPADFMDFFLLFENNKKSIDWVISGGESGPKARPAKTDWFEFVRKQCELAGIAYFHKQNGGHSKLLGHWGGNKINGKTYNAYPL